jgi:hypothetical protein
MAWTHKSARKDAGVSDALCRSGADIAGARWYVRFGTIPLKKSVCDRGGPKLQREPTASQAGFGCGIGTSLASFRRF